VNGVTDGPDWRKWLERHGPALVLYARQIVHDGALAEDAVQDGFVRFWRRRDQADDAAALLYAAVRSAALDLLRRRQRHGRRERAAAPPEVCFDVTAEERERAARVTAALAELPPEQREAVVLKIWAGLTFGQIAAAVGEPANTVASRYRYAMEKLAARLGAEVRDG
jgi:RNA polymerase sigma-70 factor (ECF subfamily)